MTNKNEWSKILAQKSDELARSLAQFADENYDKFTVSGKKSGLPTPDTQTFKACFICGVIEAINCMLTVAQDGESNSEVFDEVLNKYASLNDAISKSHEFFGFTLEPDFDSLGDFGPKDSLN